MNKLVLFFYTVTAILSSSIVNARTLYVGAQQKYASIDEVQHVIEDGDVIEIVPGTYRDCAVFIHNNIVIRPKGWSQKKR